MVYLLTFYVAIVKVCLLARALNSHILVVVWHAAWTTLARSKVIYYIYYIHRFIPGDRHRFSNWSHVLAH